MFAMSGDGNDNVSIPLVFLFRADAQVLFDALEENSNLLVALSDYETGKFAKNSKLKHFGLWYL